MGASPGGQGPPHFLSYYRHAKQRVSQAFQCLSHGFGDLGRSTTNLSKVGDREARTHGLDGEIGYPKPDKYEEAVISAQKEYLAFPVLSGANGTRFGGLKDKPENKSLLGHDNYPKDKAELLHIMNKYKPEVAHIQCYHKNIRKIWHSFKLALKRKKIDRAISDKSGPPGGTGRTKSNAYSQVACFYCGAEDHWQYECPKLKPAERVALLKIKTE